MDIALRNAVDVNREFKAVVKQIHYLDIRQRAALERLTSLTEKYISIMKEISGIDSSTVRHTSGKHTAAAAGSSTDSSNNAKSLRTGRDNAIAKGTLGQQDVQVIGIGGLPPEVISDILIALERDIRLAEDEVHELSSTRMALLQTL